MRLSLLLGLFLVVVCVNAQFDGFGGGGQMQMPPLKNSPSPYGQEILPFDAGRCDVICPKGDKKTIDHEYSKTENHPPDPLCSEIDSSFDFKQCCDEQYECYFTCQTAQPPPPKKKRKRSKKKKVVEEPFVSDKLACDVTYDQCLTNVCDAQDTAEDKAKCTEERDAYFEKVQKKSCEAYFYAQEQACLCDKVHPREAWAKWERGQRVAQFAFNQDL